MRDVEKGTDIDGQKVVEKLCGCGHHKRDHADKEITGNRVKQGDQYITPITYKKNKGRCTKRKCDCYEYGVGAVLLDNGEILKYSEFFGCETCGKYFGNKKRAKGLYWTNLCASCAPKFYKESVDKLNAEIILMEAFKKHLNESHPVLATKTAGFEKDFGGYSDTCYANLNISVLMVVDKLVFNLKEERDKWESYI